ncbi:MAG: OprM [Herbaspirillum sp.]|jgi:multidrug efflux system outer membrane protein|nr:OprM [Herbaspirillum sp.]
MRSFAAAAIALTLTACATQPAYAPPKQRIPSNWENTPVPSTPHGVIASGQWWTQLGDPAIDSLIASAFADSPTLAQAGARVDQARAAAGVASAQRMPAVTGSASATRAQIQNIAGVGGSPTLLESSASAGANFSWEIDLWGRIRESVSAAQRRLDASTADAQGARLSLAAQVATTSLSLRACAYSLQVRDADIASRETELALTRKRREVGYIAPAAEFSALTNLANARTARISQQEQCTRSVDALVALTGRPAYDVRRLLLPAASGADPVTSEVLDDVAHVMPTPPAMQAALPATVLRDHPSLVSAERSLAAAWSDIAVARAQRLPTISLSAALSGQWLRALGSSIDYTTWSAGPALSLPLFDGGAGAANVDAATGRYREAAATLQATLRTVVQNVEDALAFQTSAEERVKSSLDAVDAAQRSFGASQAQWRAGAISMFELEDARRQRQTAEENYIAAKRDQGQAWVSLMQATGQIDNPT